MTTTFPEGIAIPDKVDSRLGVLNFRDGFPDQETVKIFMIIWIFKGLCSLICLHFRQLI